MSRNLLGQPTRGGLTLGCSRCALNNASGINKVMGLHRITGKRVMVWAQNPGKVENEKGWELCGPSGQLVWKAFKTIGLTRDDCDVQNAGTRCRPIGEDGFDRDPTKDELRCCSVYNDEALDRNQGNAVVHVIFGDIAGVQLLGDKFKKDRPVFWHEPWNAYVVLMAHPSYILRKGGENAGWDYDESIDSLHAVRAILDHPGRWGYIKTQDCRIVRTESVFNVMKNILLQDSLAGRRISLDIEDGTVNEKPALLMVGFGTGYYENPADWRTWRGTSWSVELDHPEARLSRDCRNFLAAGIKSIVEDPSIRKAMQHGSYDDQQMRKLLGARLQGYDYDTQYGTYLRHSFLRSVSLESMTYRFLPEFADYKETTGGYKNFADCPLDLLALRNGGDCHVTKRMEEKIAPQINYELLQVYIHAAYTLDGMKHRGPWLDIPNWEIARRDVGEKQANGKFNGLLGKIDQQLQHMTGNPNFNPGSQPQVAALLYDQLGLPITEAGRATGYEVLQELLLRSNHPALKIMEKRRAVGHVQSDLTSYRNSADKHGGQLRTIWHLTGAVTGRLRSGKGKEGTEAGVLNFQNLASTATLQGKLLQSILISDPRWREALDE
jgi:uracil-DNA glycosylase family 4